MSAASPSPLKVAIGFLLVFALMEPTPWVAALCAGVAGGVLATLAGSAHGVWWGLFEAAVGGMVGLVLTMRSIVRQVVGR